jgi:hypothetical protein
VFRFPAVHSFPALLAPMSLFRSLRTPSRLCSLLSAIGAICGIGGTALLALRPDQMTPVFALYLAAASSWMGVGRLTRQRWLLASNVVYFGLAVKGLMF